MTHSTLPARRKRLVVLALAIAVLVALGSASARAFGAENGDSSSSEAVTAPSLEKATVKSLQKQLKKLTKRIVSLEQQGTSSPSGPAGGDLTGSYPKPTIAANTIGPGKIPDETLTGYEIAPDSLYHNDLAADSVGGSELKGSNAVVSGGVSVPENQVRSTSVTCPAGQHLLSGGFAWQGTAGRILDSAPSLTVPNRWEVRGFAAANESLFAWALCLQA